MSLGLRGLPAPKNDFDLVLPDAGAEVSRAESSRIEPRASEARSGSTRGSVSSCVARWAPLRNADNTGLPGANGRIASGAMYGGMLYVGGSFTQVGAVRAAYVGRWTGTRFEAVGNGLVDAQGNVVEGPGFNVFVVRNGALATPARGLFEGMVEALS